MRHYRTILQLLFLLILCFSYGETRSQTAPLRIQLPETKFSQLFIAMLDRDIEHGLKIYLDPQRDTTEILPEALAGAMAHAYTLPQSKFYQQPATLQSIRSLFSTLQTNLGESYETYRLVEKVEPLLCVFVCLQNTFSEEEQARYRTILENTLQTIQTNPIKEQNHQGMACCTVLALGSKVLGNEGYMTTARVLFQRIAGMFTASGEVRENNTPDLWYSAHSIESLFRYRRLTDDASLDAMLIKSLRWYTDLYTENGWPLLTFKTQDFASTSLALASLLGPLAYYENEEPLFAKYVRNYIQKLMEDPPGFSLHRGAEYFLQGAQFHDTATAVENQAAAPLARLYSNSDSHYFLVRNNYRTAVCLRNKTATKGMQTWAYQNQKPLLFPANGEMSKTVGFGFDTSAIDAQIHYNQYSYKITRLSDQLHCVVVQRGDVFSGYIFSPDATIVLLRNQTNQGMITEWIMDTKVCTEPSLLTKGALSFKDSTAILSPGLFEPELSQQTDFHLIHFSIPSEVHWNAFSSPNTQVLFRPVVDNLYFVHIKEPNQSWNVVLNMGETPFMKQATFPGTSIPIPTIPPYGAVFAKE